MKKITLATLAISFFLFLFSGCKSGESDGKNQLPKDPKITGKELGTLECKQKSLIEDYNELAEKINQLDDQDEDDRKEIVKLRTKISSLNKEYLNTQIIMADLADVQWQFFANQKKYEEWMKSFQKAFTEAVQECSEEN
ncbi:MAG: hypothetical protein JW801_06145 [Bacteroidales bacterium]|nr:hypothetical protein [Bacteroidales bacterium]